MRPDISGLEALDAVIRHGGVAQAARHLNRVQSAVSYQLGKLERQLGLRLLDRTGYRVRLTPAGEAVLAEGRRLLAQADHLVSLAQLYSTGWEPRLTIIVDGILPIEPVLIALRKLADEGVPTRVQLKVEFLHGVQFRFEQDAADLMLVKDYDPKPQLRADALPDVECILCASAGHPLTHPRRVGLAELLEYVELSVQDSSGQGDDRHMFGGERVFFMSDFAAKRQALLMGSGFGWMPRYLIAEDLQEGTLKEVHYADGSRYQFTPMLVHRLDRPRGKTGVLLSELLMSRPHQAPASGAVRSRRRRPLARPR